jgi:hypothetical protein
MIASADRHDIFSLESTGLTDISEHEVRLDGSEV